MQLVDLHSLVGIGFSQDGYTLHIAFNDVSSKGEDFPHGAEDVAPGVDLEHGQGTRLLGLTQLRLLGAVDGSISVVRSLCRLGRLCGERSKVLK